MNQELKSLIDIAFIGLKLGEDAAEKKNLFQLLPDFYNLVITTPRVVENWSDLQNEIQALSGTEQEKDLMNYIEQKWAGFGNSQTQDILNACLDLIQCVVQKSLILQKLIKS